MATAPPTYSPRAGPLTRQGTSLGGRFLLEVPAGWNGGLVLFAHGYQGEDGPPQVELEPLGAWLLSQDYAWAACSYRSTGYHPDWFLEDTLALKDLVTSEVGAPRWTILHGQSMGGHVVVASLELHPGAYQGALAECGVVDGVSEGDYEVAYAAAAEYLSGIPLLDPPDAATFQERVGEWLRVMGGPPPAHYTERGRRFDSVLKYLMGGSRRGDLPERLAGLNSVHYTRNLGPHYAPEQSPESMPIRRAVDTRGVRYQVDPGLAVTEEELNAHVRRFAPAPGARSPSTNPVFAEPTGRLSAPLLTLHTTGDAWVPFRLEQQYRRRVDAAGAGRLLVQRAIRRAMHCDISGAERRQAASDLVAWIERGTRPEGDDVLTADPAALGQRWTRLI